MTWKSVIVKYNSTKGLAVRNIVDSDSFQPIIKPLVIKIISVKIHHPTSHPRGTVGILSSNKITSFEENEQSVVKNQFCPLAHIDLYSSKGETKLVTLNLSTNFLIDSGEAGIYKLKIKLISLSIDPYIHLVCFWISDDTEKRVKHDCQIEVLINYQIL